MKSLEGLWEKFSLLDIEENGIECTKKDALANFILAAKFLMKWIVNVESVSCIFRPLWRLEKDVQIKDMGENILFFHFEDKCDHDCQNRDLDGRIARFFDPTSSKPLESHYDHKNGRIMYGILPIVSKTKIKIGFFLRDKFFVLMKL